MLVNDKAFLIGAGFPHVRMVACGAKFWKCEKWKILLYKKAFLQG